MVVGWFTDNSISQTIMQKIAESGITIKHIKDFEPQTSIFYGILRGCATAMHICRATGNDFLYLDNGYTEAEYIDSHRVKKTHDGTYRICQNDMHVLYREPIYSKTKRNGYILILPPSPYSANYCGTTPEDWLQFATWFCENQPYKIRGKESLEPLDLALSGAKAVLAFNSVSLVRAAELGVPIYDTHGFLRNANRLKAGLETINYEKMRSFLTSKQAHFSKLGEYAWR